MKGKVSPASTPTSPSCSIITASRKSHYQTFGLSLSLGTDAWHVKSQRPM